MGFAELLPELWGKDGGRNKMTKKEAIKWITYLRENLGNTEYRGLWHYEEPLTDIIEFLQTEPEIIKCKDCRYYDGRPCGIVDWYNGADDFCSRAERRADD